MNNGRILESPKTIGTLSMVNGEYIETEKEYERLHTLATLRR